MRHDKAALVVELARRLAGSAEGLTLNEMAEAIGVGRRTAERLRDAVVALFPQMEVVEDPPTRRFRIPGGLDGFLQAPTTAELAALRRASEGYAASGQTADDLRALDQKVLAAMKAPLRRRLGVDLEALMQAEAIALQPGPRPFEDEAGLSVIRQAILAGHALAFRYARGSRPGAVREVTPYGLLFGRSNFLVAAEGEDPAPKTWRLDAMAGLAVLERPASPPADFSLQAFAEESFGIYHDQVEDVALRFTPTAADSARRWRFHPRQTIEACDDGAVIVRFRAAGMNELASHLFTWDEAVTILEPASLRERLAERLRAALAHHA